MEYAKTRNIYEKCKNSEIASKNLLWWEANYLYNISWGDYTVARELKKKLIYVCRIKHSSSSTRLSCRRKIDQRYFQIKTYADYSSL
jgi:hypothetical protein